VDVSDGYRFDLFVSYSRTPNASKWVCTHFVPTLRDELTEELGREPQIFLDVQQEAGTSWPDNLLWALQRSKLLVAVWAPPYFRSHWCLAEWHTFRRRERQLGVGPGGLRPLVYPIRFRDGDRFPSEAGTVQQEMCFKEYCNPDPQFATSHAFEPFRKKVQAVAEQLALRLDDLPEWTPDWVAERPSPPPLDDTGLPLLGGRS
jgi:hypothetical protein